MSDLRNFAYAAAKRYSGSYVPGVGDPAFVPATTPMARARRSGRPPLARLERGEQPRLPRAAVRPQGQEVGSNSPVALRQDLLVGLHRAST